MGLMTRTFTPEPVDFVVDEAARTAALRTGGVAMGVLHAGAHYPDDLTEERGRERDGLPRAQGPLVVLPIVGQEPQVQAVVRLLAAMFAFGYRFLGRSIEDADAVIENLTVMDDRIVIWVSEDKTHKGEVQTIIFKDRPDLQLVRRMRAWLGYLASVGVVTGPVFRHLLKNGLPATEATRAKTATTRGAHLRGHVVNERVKHWFAKAGLVSDGRPS